VNGASSKLIHPSKYINVLIILSPDVLICYKHYILVELDLQTKCYTCIMTIMNEINQFLAEYPSDAEAAKELGVTRQYIWMLKTERRQMSRKVAQKIEIASGGRYKKNRLFWGAT
jgi:hypothetical protein